MSSRSKRCIAAFAVALGAGTLGLWTFRSPTPDPRVGALDFSNLVTADKPVREAIERARNQVVAQPTSAETWARLGMTAQAHGFLNEARDSYARANELAPGDARWAHLLGITCQELSLPQDAEKAFAEAAGRDPRDLVSLCSLALLLTDRGEEDAARQIYLRVLEVSSAYTAARIGLGQLALKAGDLQASRKNLDLALESEPRSGAAHATLATLCAREGKTNEAAIHRRWSRTTSAKIPLPDPLMDQVFALGVSYTAHLKRGKDAGASGDWQRAVTELREAVKLRANVAEARYYFGSSLLRAGAHEDGLKELLAVTTLDAKRVEAWLQIARAHLSKGSPASKAEAMTALDKAIAEDETSSEAHLLRGRVLQAEGERALALAEVDRAIQHHPEDASARIARGQFLLVPGNEREAAAKDKTVHDSELARAEAAIREFQQAIELEPDAPEAYDGAGLAAMQLWDLTIESARKEERLGAALEGFSEAVRWFPRRKEGHARLIQALRSAQKDAELKEAVRRAHAAWPEDARFAEGSEREKNGRQESRQK